MQCLHDGEDLVLPCSLLYRAELRVLSLVMVFPSTLHQIEVFLVINYTEFYLLSSVSINDYMDFLYCIVIINCID